MPKIKVPRKNISLDMTAMCDMAFLLLTFFILTAQMKSPEAVVVDMPASISEKKLPDSDLITILVGKNGSVYLKMDSQQGRKQLIEKVTEKYEVKLTDKEKNKFALMESFGVPFKSVKKLINDETLKENQPGIPCDSIHNELDDWLTLARLANPEARIAIKGDKETDYEAYQAVVSTLQDQNINKFSLVTTLAAKPD